MSNHGQRHPIGQWMNLEGLKLYFEKVQWNSPKYKISENIAHGSGKYHLKKLWFQYI